MGFSLPNAIRDKLRPGTALSLHKPKGCRGPAKKKRKKNHVPLAPTSFGKVSPTKVVGT